MSFATILLIALAVIATLVIAALLILFWSSREIDRLIRRETADRQPTPESTKEKPRRNYPPVGSRIPVPAPSSSYVAPPAKQAPPETGSDMTNTVLMYSLLNSSSHATECSAPKESEPFTGGGGEAGGAGASGGWTPSPSNDSGSSSGSSSSDCGSSSDSSSSSSCSSD